LNQKTRITESVDYAATYDRNQKSFGELTKFDASAIACALNYGGRYAGYEASANKGPSGPSESSAQELKGIPSIPEKVRKAPEPAVKASDSEVGVKRPCPSTTDATAGSRSYRQQTSELINRLDKLLKFPANMGSGAGLKTVRGASGKGRSRRPARDLAKPRARNVVLKQAVELIWRIKCDEQVLSQNFYYEINDFYL